MNLTNLSVANLISFAGLFQFFDRLIVDSNYKTVVLISNDETFGEYSNFPTELAQRTYGKCATAIVNFDIVPRLFGDSVVDVRVFSADASTLSIFPIAYDEDNMQAFETRLLRNRIVRDERNIVFVILHSIQSNDEKDEILEISRKYLFRLYHNRNVSMIFYKVDAKLRGKSTEFETFILRRKNTESIDVADMMMSDSNLNEKFFGKQLVISFVTHVDLNLTALAPGNLFNFGNAEYYFNNLIARHLRHKNIDVRQMRVIHGKQYDELIYYQSKASELKFYGELFNEVPVMR